MGSVYNRIHEFVVWFADCPNIELCYYQTKPLFGFLRGRLQASCLRMLRSEENLKSQHSIVA